MTVIEPENRESPAVASDRQELKSWLSIAHYLAQKFAVTYSQIELANRIGRIVTEKASPVLVIDAISSSLGKESLALELRDLPAFRRKYPILVISKAGKPFAITGKATRGAYAIIGPTADGTLQEGTVDKKLLQSQWARGVAFEDPVPLDVWQQDLTFRNRKNWFWGSITPLLKSMRYLILAAVFGNILSIGVSLFSMQVWDRVIPAQSANSLIVLGLGVVLASFLDMILRLQRAALIDEVGKSVDMQISAGVFDHMLQLKSDARPASLGSLASQIREINQIREVISSSMLSAAIEIPFIIIYLSVIYLIGGILVYPVLAVVPAVLLISLIAQIPLSRLADQGLEEASVRNGLIVESVLKADEIKLQEAERTMALRWSHTIETGQDVSARQRFWRNLLTNLTQTLQQFGYIGVIALGAIMVIEGTATMGQVIACSILANRSVAPLSQVAAVMSALQGSIAAKRSIDDMMKRPVDTPNQQHLRRELQQPELSIKTLQYSYPNTENVSLDVAALKISYGERIGIVGRIGSGKSTLLRLMSGLSEPSSGTILLDNTEIAAIHPADVRRTIAYQSQGSTLFRGSLRDNLAIARPAASDADMVAACKVAGVLELIQNNPRGLDLPINEAGQGLSGGQKQSVLLARAILRDPKILLLDEPTASMDDQTEAKFTADLDQWAKDRTIVIATHRMRPLSICHRLLVIDNGRLVMDGPKDAIIAKLSKNGAA